MAQSFKFVQVSFQDVSVSGLSHIPDEFTPFFIQFFVNMVFKFIHTFSFTPDDVNVDDLAKTCIKPIIYIFFENPDHVSSTGRFLLLTLMI